MAPVPVQVSTHLRHMIFYHLDNDLLQNALFLAGRLQGLEPRNPDVLHLLALCHLRLGQFRAAYDVTRTSVHRGAHLGCAYVFAQACLALDRHNEGIAALERVKAEWEHKKHWNRPSETMRRHLPDAAAVYCLLGKLAHANNDLKRAIDCYDDALKLNPFMWDAFEQLCDTGTKLNLSNIFKTNMDMLASLSLKDTTTTRQEPQASNLPQDDPFASTSKSSEVPVHCDDSRPPHKPQEVHETQFSNIDTPPYRIHSQDSAIMGVSSLEPPNAPIRKVRAAQTWVADPKLRTRERPNQVSEGNDAFGIHRPASGLPTNKRTVSGSASQASLPGFVDSATTQRKSERILNRIRPTNSRTGASNATIGTRDGRDLKKVRATGTKGRLMANPSMVGRVVSGNRKPLEGVDKTGKARLLHQGSDMESNSQTSLSSIDRSTEALEWLLDLLMKIGKGYFALNQYQCQEAIQIFNSIMPQQRETPWVLSKIGKAYYEQSKYAEAGQTFSRLKAMAPSRLEDMEVYSTVLWHLKHDTELAFLSYELIDADRSSPQAWCAIGNSFSLQRDHDQAIKCFKRATQLDPGFAYGHTLQGHEHMTNEEYDKALISYREAVKAERRHYNGWYGLGKVFEKLGQYDMAEKHFRAAADINPTNSVLMVCIGVVQEKLRKPHIALASFDKACKLAPHSALARFRRARTLMSLQRNTEALTELAVLKDLAPDEVNVHFMLAKLYKNMQDRPNAIKHYTVALNLDPKAGGYIKEAMEAMDDDEDDLEDDDDQMS